MGQREIADYITDLLAKHNLSQREGSMKAGLAPETLSKIIGRRSSIPRPETLRAIADGLGGDFETMMILAGHLEEPPIAPTMDQAVQQHVLRLSMLWGRVNQVAPNLLSWLAEQAVNQAELVLAAVETSEKKKALGHD